MKIMIASDIHGSAYWCGKLLERFEEEQPDKLLLLGDLLYHGPRNPLPKEYNPQDVITILSPLAKDILCVQGNCDSPVDQMVLPFPIMADYAILYTGKTMIFATHGHTHNLDALPPLHKGDVLLHGHTHVPAALNQGGILYINPGSVSLPKEASCNSYILLEDNLFTWKNLNGEAWKTYAIG